MEPSVSSYCNQSNLCSHVIGTQTRTYGMFLEGSTAPVICASQLLLGNKEESTF